jgi:hypothetical protein
MPNNATLTLRCPTKGHSLVEVIYETGKPFAYCKEYATRLVLDDNQPKAIPLRFFSKTQPGGGFSSRYDLLEEYPDKTIITVVCKCGRRNVSLAHVLDLVQQGVTGKTLTDSNTF